MKKPIQSRRCQATQMDAIQLAAIRGGAIRRVEPDTIDPASYEYDDPGRLISTTDPGN